MIPKGLFSQFGMLIISVGIILTYVQPSFDEIDSVQDDIEVYKKELEKVSAVNKRLSGLVGSLESVSAYDRGRLLTYLPDTIDTISVLRDLTIISDEAGVFYKTALYVGKENDSPKNNQVSNSINTLPQQHTFTLSVEGTYQQLKNLLALMERNHYPLEISNIMIKELEVDLLSLDVTLTAFSYNKEEDSVNRIIF